MNTFIRNYLLSINTIRIMNIICTLVSLISMSTRLFIHTKSRPHAFFHLIRFEKFPQTCIFTYKRQIKYPTHAFIQDHTIIRATRVQNEYVMIQNKTDCEFKTRCCSRLPATWATHFSVSWLQVITFQSVSFFHLDFTMIYTNQKIVPQKHFFVEFLQICVNHSKIQMEQ